MILPPDQRCRTVRSGGSRDWAAELARRGRGEGWEVLKDHPGGTVWRAELAGQRCVVKCVSLRRLKRRAQALLGRTPLERQWEGASVLRRLGVETAPMHALVIGEREGDRVEALVMGEVPGQTVLRALAEGRMGARREHELARRVAQVTETLWQGGYRNRDHKPSNLLVSDGEPGGMRVSLIDTGAIRRTHWMQAEDDIMDMLAKLVIEPLGCGRPVRRAVMMRLLRERCGMANADGDEELSREDVRREIRGAWEEISELVAAHGDPTPKHDPLA